MPTYETLPRFVADLGRLTPEQRRRFRQTVTVFVEDLRTGRFRAGLREAREFADSWRGQPLNPRVVTPLSRERGRVRLSLQGCAGCQD